MNRIVIVFLVFAFASLPVLSSGFGLVFNVNYNTGISDFFERNEVLFQSGGNNFLESKRNRLGTGFNAGVIIPVSSKWSLIPAVSVNFGHQSYEFGMVDGESDSDVSANYSFLIISGEIKSVYDLIDFRNGWKFSLLFGINYNRFSADGETGYEDRDFWGAEAGAGVKFFQLEHFGFQTFLIYRHPFSGSNFKYLTLQAGIIYRF